jgi:hypothetical protein
LTMVLLFNASPSPTGGPRSSLAAGATNTSDVASTAEEEEEEKATAPRETAKPPATQHVAT